MSQAKPVIGFKGVKTSGNPLAFGPGALAKAQNCCISSRDVLSPRRGQRLDGARYIDDDEDDEKHNRASEIFQWGDDLVVHYEGDDGGFLSILQDFLTGDSPTLVGAAERPFPDELRMKFAELVGSLYFTTDVGVQTLDSAAGSLRHGGIPRPGDFKFFESPEVWTRLSGNPNAAGTWMPTDSAVGFKATVGLLDANNVLRESAPNGRCVVRNPKDITVAIGGLARAANEVTAQVGDGHNLRVGDVVDLTLAGADASGSHFDTTANVITEVTDTTVKWDETASNYTNVAEVVITSGTKKVQLVFDLPPNLSTSYFVRLYRTDESAGANIDPGNEHFLCIERRLTDAEVSAREVTLSDTTPSDFLGEDLYTNPNGGDGPLSANDEPPHAADICTFDSRMFYFRTHDRHRLFLRLLGCGSPDGLQALDVLAINDRFYTFVTVGTVFSGPGTNLTTEHTPSRNIADTLNALMSLYNEDLGGTSSVGVSKTRARVVTDGDTPTGKVLVEQRYLDGEPMHAAVSRQSAWADPLPLVKAVDNANSSRTANVVTIKTTTAHGFIAGQRVRLACDLDGPASGFAPGVKTIATVPGSDTFTYAETGADAAFDDDDFGHVVYPLDYESDDYEKPVRFSKQGEPESCPLAYNIDDRLPSGATVLRGRASAQNDRLYLFLEGGDVYELSGSAPYTVRRFDGTAELLAGDSLKEHAGRLLALTTQGVVAIDDSGIALSGLDLEEELLDLLAEMDSNDVSLGDIFAVSYEADRQYQLWLPKLDDDGELADDGVVQQAMLLYSLTGQWYGPWLGRRTCGLVFRRGGGSGLLVLGDGEHNQVRIERKARDFTDFADEDADFTIGDPSTTGTNVINIANAEDPSDFGEGDICEAPTGSGQYFRITATTTLTVTVDGTLPELIPDNTVTLFKRYQSALKWHPDSAGQGGLEKHWRELQLHFKKYLVDELEVRFSSEKTDTEKPVTIGNRAFEIGHPIERLLIKRADVTKGISRAASLSVEVTLEEAFSFFQLLGYSVSAGDGGTEKSGA